MGMPELPWTKCRPIMSGKKTVPTNYQLLKFAIAKEGVFSLRKWDGRWKLHIPKWVKQISLMVEIWDRVNPQDLSPCYTTKSKHSQMWAECISLQPWLQQWSHYGSFFQRYSICVILWYQFLLQAFEYMDDWPKGRVNKEQFEYFVKKLQHNVKKFNFQWNGSLQKSGLTRWFLFVFAFTEPLCSIFFPMCSGKLVNLLVFFCR